MAKRLKFKSGITGETFTVEWDKLPTDNTVWPNVVTEKGQHVQLRHEKGTLYVRAINDLGGLEDSVYQVQLPVGDKDKTYSLSEKVIDPLQDETASDQRNKPWIENPVQASAVRRSPELGSFIEKELPELEAGIASQLSPSQVLEIHEHLLELTRIQEAFKAAGEVGELEEKEKDAVQRRINQLNNYRSQLSKTLTDYATLQKETQQFFTIVSPSSDIISNAKPRWDAGELHSWNKEDIASLAMGERHPVPCPSSKANLYYYPNRSSAEKPSYDTWLVEGRLNPDKPADLKTAALVAVNYVDRNPPITIHDDNSITINPIYVSGPNSELLQEAILVALKEKNVPKEKLGEIIKPLDGPQVTLQSRGPSIFGGKADRIKTLETLIEEARQQKRQHTTLKTGDTPTSSSEKRVRIVPTQRSSK